jgi:2-methylcitrate dehydratase PrpD
MVGATAAALAREGFTGAPAVTVEGSDVAELWSDFGRRWRILEQYFKPYPVCRWAQPAMEAAAALRAEHHFAPEAISAITVRTFHEASCLAVAEPKGSDEAQYSLPFPLAALLVRGRVGPAELDGAGLADADVLRVSRSVRLVDEPRYSALFPAERWADVEIVLADGRRLGSRPAVARGSAENPLSDGEIAEKFHALMEASGCGDRADAVEREVMAIERAPTLAPLLSLIGRPASPAFSEAAQ